MCLEVKYLQSYMIMKAGVKDEGYKPQCYNRYYIKKADRTVLLLLIKI